MKLSEDMKRLVLGNIDLIKYCNQVGIDMEKLSKCRIEKMGTNYVFALSKENVPVSKQLIPLDYDLDSQPDIVLILNFDNNVINFETFNETKRVLNL